MEWNSHHSKPGDHIDINLKWDRVASVRYLQFRCSPETISHAKTPKEKAGY
jgi:hypothetical protein